MIVGNTALEKQMNAYKFLLLALILIDGLRKKKNMLE